MTTSAITDASGNIVTEFTVPQSAPAGVQTLAITVGGLTRRTEFMIAGTSSMPTPVQPSAQTNLDAGLARINDSISLYSGYTGGIGELCVDLRELIDSFNVSGVAKSIDHYVNNLAAEYWSKSGNFYFVRVFQGLPPPHQIISAKQSELCQN